jgi:hypothetical protein
MARTPSTLRELVEQALGAPTPEAGLRAVTLLRAAVDELERTHARRALEAGCSFGIIARALGITRQSAHRRYRHLLEEPPPELPPALPGRVLVTAEARTAVRFARKEARALGMATLGSEHLLLGVLRAGGATGEALRELGVTLDAARTGALPTLTDVPGASEPAERRGISTYVRRVLAQSLREAVARGDGYIGTDHLLLAALGDPSGGAARTLEAIGVSAIAVRGRLETASRLPAPGTSRTTSSASATGTVAGTVSTIQKSVSQATDSPSTSTATGHCRAPRAASTPPSTPATSTSP